MSPTMSFQLPTNGEQYTNYIIDRAKALIKCNVWEGINELDLNQWLNNFQSPTNRYFAARILDTLLYRSQPQTISMLKHMFQRTIPNIARQHELPSQLCSAYEHLQRLEEPHIRLVPVIPRPQYTSSSGPLVTRLIDQHLRFNSNWIITLDKIKSTTPFIVFIDDFIGTGDQLSSYLRKHNLEYLVTEQRCCFVALAAHNDGIDRLGSEFKNIRISAVELLDPSVGLFHEQSPAFKDGTNTFTTAREWYNEMLEEFQIKGHRIAEGYGSQCLTYVFSHAVPNNCTPLLWWSKSSKLFPLFHR